MVVKSASKYNNNNKCDKQHPVHVLFSTNVFLCELLAIRSFLGAHKKKKKKNSMMTRVKKTFGSESTVMPFWESRSKLF